MGFWTGVADYLGLRPINSFRDFGADTLALISGGAYQADDRSFSPSNLLFGHGYAAPAVAGINDVWSDKVSTTMDGTIDAINTLRETGLGDYGGDMFQTDADAALDQAAVNDDLAKAAWLRSEESADKAQARARELRRTYYQDLMRSLKEAGLNPVLAASGGFGGVSSSAPMGTSQAATSQKADGLNAADLIEAIASVLTGAGSLARGVSSFLPTTVIRK